MYKSIKLLECADFIFHISNLFSFLFYFFPINESFAHVI